MEARDPETMPVGPATIRMLLEKIADLEKRVQQLERKATR